MTQSRRTTTAIAVVLAAILIPAALQPIASYDFFWHLATGRWIAEHHALPLFDPFSVGTDHIPWINGEWLFELVLYLVGSLQRIAMLRAVLLAATFSTIFFLSARRSQPSIALAVTAVAFLGAQSLLDARPSTVAAMILAAGIALLDVEHASSDLAYVVLTVLWINVHPSALLAPLIALAARRIHWLPLATLAALLVNPFGWKAIAAPVALDAFARSGAFVNAEWLPSSPLLFPVLYATVLIAVIAFVMARRVDWHLIVLAGLAYLAIEHVRNQGLYFVALPLLAVPAIDQAFGQRKFSIIASDCVAIAAILVALLRGEHHGGLARDRFPVRATAELQRSGLQGNIYNADQFGGFLIWATYPNRRVITDGRNELYHSFIREYAAARLDSRAWRVLLREYRIDLAVDEYRPLLDTINPRTGEHRAVPASLAYWPRREWALIGFDNVAMVFARRAAYASGTLDKLEVKGVIPDAPGQRGRQFTSSPQS